MFGVHFQHPPLYVASRIALSLRAPCLNNPPQSRSLFTHSLIVTLLCLGVLLPRCPVMQPSPKPSPAPTPGLAVTIVSLTQQRLALGNYTCTGTVKVTKAGTTTAVSSANAMIGWQTLSSYNNLFPYNATLTTGSTGQVSSTSRAIAAGKGCRFLVFGATKSGYAQLVLGTPLSTSQTF